MIVNTLGCPKAMQLADHMISPLHGIKEEREVFPTVMKPSVQTDYTFMESLKKINHVHLHGRTVTDKPQKMDNKGHCKQ